MAYARYSIYAVARKNQKMRYLTNRWTDFDEIWHSQASRFSRLLNIIMTCFPLVLIVSFDISVTSKWRTHVWSYLQTDTWQQLVLH